ncbi:MAG: zinc chelation protein SecC [Verrucomicrobia bacterium]|nr:zinc chelation protein SecC [Verrucomicrobiota bacterium]
MYCPCHSGKPYSECCEPYHRGKPAENALILMRSRYSAYALSLSDYIIDTELPSKSSREEILSFSKSTQFEGLEILEFIDGESQAFVTFIARLTRQGRDASFKERSAFTRISGRWYYSVVT